MPAESELEIWANNLADWTAAYAAELKDALRQAENPQHLSLLKFLSRRFCYWWINSSASKLVTLGSGSKRFEAERRIQELSDWCHPAAGIPLASSQRADLCAECLAGIASVDQKLETLAGLLAGRYGTCLKNSSSPNTDTASLKPLQTASIFASRSNASPSLISSACASSADLPASSGALRS